MSDILDSVSLDSYAVTILMLSMCVFIYANHSAKQFLLLKTLNSVDELTGAFNRRAMRTGMQAALSDAENNDTQQLLAILDMDYFKKVNDNYGHAVGDQVLKDFVRITTSHIGKNDRLYRFGGEEFVLLVPNYTDQSTYITALMAAIKKELKTPDGKIITVSYGVAKWLPGTTIDTWLKRADVALYLAKEKGRDCAVYNDD
ncbi:GGDEF domain-containing protein [Shewanella sp. OMA3-2]|uniref:GGDEF domain-containing protein n=1 Tax=Shewanella sp. OMA3-2 TaxID=2908650 RepID=UPI001F3CD028|nr:GGDEF domain-containing protein [Shewanella sp. OMA3-2]UJF20894.1 GGDEF domain-containing protein [Shewanella sp. OMA3-2]